MPSAREITHLPTDSLVQGRLAEQLQQATSGYYEIQAFTFDAPFVSAQHAVRLSGRFLVPTETAYDAISERVRAARLLVFFRREAGAEVIYALPDQFPTLRPRVHVAIGLFLATVLSVFVTGATVMRSADSSLFFDWRSGVTYALPLMTILLAHELGHFFVARRNRMAVSPPYFIPLPIVSLGTLGAVIAMLAPPKNRRHLLQMAAAGPLAGLALALPILIYGLLTSPVGPLPTQPYMLEGNSVVYAGLKWLVFGQFLPGGGLDVSLNNIAFAGWVGLLITALNLIPAGHSTAAMPCSPFSASACDP